MHFQLFDEECYDMSVISCQANYILLINISIALIKILDCIKKERQETFSFFKNKMYYQILIIYNCFWDNLIVILPTLTPLVPFPNSSTKY